MAFGLQQIAPIDTRTSIAVGLNLPFNGDAVFVPNYTTRDAIKTRMINYLLTNTGERYLNPGFGANLRALLFQQQGRDISEIKRIIELQVGKYFPQVLINVINVLEDPSNVNGVIVNITYSITNSSFTDTLQINFT